LYTANTTDISNRPEFIALTSNVEGKKFMVKAEKSHYLPKVLALASVRYDNIFNADVDLSSPLPMTMGINHIGLGPTYMVGVGFKWDIFDISGSTSGVKQANLEVRKAENARDEVEELLQLNLFKVSTSYESAISQVTYKRKQLQAAQMALQLAQKAYNEGMMNITERLATETQMQNAELEYLQAIFNQRQSALECYKANGNLTLENIQ